MDPSPDNQRVSDARANLTELIASVRMLRRAVLLTSRSKPVAALVPAELGQLVRDVGGPDAAIAILRAHDVASP